MAGIEELLIDVLPVNHARQVHVCDELASHLQSLGDGVRLLDLGCGDGRALDGVRANGKSVRYTGIDIEDSPEVRSRRRSDGDFMTFDGINIPFPDQSFDCVYACSVLEHVRHPEKLLAEVGRVLRPGGMFFGSVSFLEPYHSYSIFNFTPYGVRTVLDAAGMRTVWLRPGIDGVTITLRSLGLARFLNRFFHSESPVNRLIQWRCRMKGSSIAHQNALKLKVTGQVVFAAERPTG
jgi:ubiquinone/menaquinone biosynthesis C-methylase UbiE